MMFRSMVCSRDAGRSFDRAKTTEAPFFSTFNNQRQSSFTPPSHSRHSPLDLSTFQQRCIAPSTATESYNEVDAGSARERREETGPVSTLCTTSLSRRHFLCLSR